MTDFTALLRMGVDASGMIAGDQALDRIVSKGGQAELKVAGALNKVSESGKRAATSLSNTATQATRAGQEISKASGHTANLTSQFNDIAVMMAAGQSPLQLAMQQGTRVPRMCGDEPSRRSYRS